MRLRSVKLSEDIVLKYLNKSENYLQCLKNKIGVEFEEGYLLHNSKKTIYFVFPSGMVLNHQLRNISPKEGKVLLAGEFKDLSKLLSRLFQYTKKSKEVEITSVKTTEDMLEYFFKDIGSIRKLTSFEDNTELYNETYIPYVHSNGVRFKLNPSKTYAEAKQSIIQYYVNLFQLEINCASVILSAKGKQYLLTEDGRVYTNTLRKLKVNKDGCVYIAGLKRNVRELIEKFFKK